jgi:hypothetical protein
MSVFRRPFLQWSKPNCQAVAIERVCNVVLKWLEFNYRICSTLALFNDASGWKFHLNFFSITHEANTSFALNMCRLNICELNNTLQNQIKSFSVQCTLCLISEKSECWVDMSAKISKGFTRHVWETFCVFRNSFACFVYMLYAELTDTKILYDGRRERYKITNLDPGCKFYSNLLLKSCGPQYNITVELFSFYIRCKFLDQIGD